MAATKKRTEGATAFLDEPAYDEIMDRGRLAHVRHRRFAGSAQAEYRSGKWRGSVGLRSIGVRAPDRAAAERLALAAYRGEWRRRRDPGDKLVKIHVHLEEV